MSKSRLCFFLQLVLIEKESVMPVSDFAAWWIAAGLLVAAEMFTGTFYLLMLAIGMTAGAVAAHLGLSQTAQMAAAAIVSAAAVFACYWIRQRRGRDLSLGADPSVNFDIGETVEVRAWKADGTASVRYRGAPWTAICRPGAAPAPGPHRVAEIVGSRLLVDPV